MLPNRAPSSRPPFGASPHAAAPGSLRELVDPSANVEIALSTPAYPLWFGASDAPLFGFYHTPSAPALDCVAVLCNPFGYDAVLSHYSYRHLAERLAAAGIAALRFDYFGTGDSSGGDEAADRVDAWQQSIAIACREARVRSGARAVALFGLRLGGLLATAVAQREAVDDLILLGPPVSGRAYVRELRALRGLATSSASPNGDGVPVPEDENFGFLITAPMKKALEGVDPVKDPRRPASRALVIPRDDGLGNEEPLVAHLRSAGVDTTRSLVAGYSLALRGDPYTCDLPDEAWTQVVEWIKKGHEKLDLEASHPVSSRSYRSVANVGGVSEEAVRFREMFGILTEPIEHTPRSETAVILVDSAANHRIGNNRMYVTWARAWAGLGFRVLRFDLAGIGDSPVQPGRREKEVYSPRAMFETQAAVDFLEDRGCKRFVVGGICSGAYVAFHSAVADARVAGVMLMNPPTFHWKEGDSLELRTRNTFSSTNAYARAALSLSTWKRALRGEVHLRAVTMELATRAVATGRSLVEDAAVRSGLLAEPDDIARGFKALVARGGDALLIYGPDDGGIDVMERHLGLNARKMQSEKGFQVRIIDGADHTFTRRAAQVSVQEVLTQHLLSRFA